MNKYLKYLLIILVSFLLLTNVSAKENKVTLYFFHGDGCPHCAAEEEFLKKNKECNIFRNTEISLGLTVILILNVLLLISVLLK